MEIEKIVENYKIVHEKLSDMFDRFCADLNEHESHLYSIYSRLIRLMPYDIENESGYDIEQEYEFIKSIEKEIDDLIGWYFQN